MILVMVGALFDGPGSSAREALFGLFLAPVVLVFTAAFEASDRSAALGGLLAAFSAGAIGGALAYAGAAGRLRRRATLLMGFPVMGVVAPVRRRGSAVPTACGSPASVGPWRRTNTEVSADANG